MDGWVVEPIKGLLTAIKKWKRRKYFGIWDQSCCKKGCVVLMPTKNSNVKCATLPTPTLVWDQIIYFLFRLQPKNVSVHLFICNKDFSFFGQENVLNCRKVHCNIKLLNFIIQSFWALSFLGTRHSWFTTGSQVTFFKSRYWILF